MENLNYIIFICIFVPIMFMALIVHPKAKPVVIFMMSGIVICLITSEINAILKNALSRDLFYITTSVTPLVEEIFKMIPVLIYAFAYNQKGERLIACAFAVGVGFAMYENLIILVGNVESISITWALMRGFASSLLHSICTCFIALSLRYFYSGSENRRKLLLPGIFCFGTISVTFHATFNVFIQSDRAYIGLCMPLAAYIIILSALIYLRKKKIEEEKS